MRVGVVGAGVGGLAVSVGLKRFGADVTVFEQAPNLGLAGAGVLLQQPGLTALGNLGLREHALDLGAKIVDLKGSTGGGKKLLDLDLRKRDTFAIGIHRGALFEILINACRSRGVGIKEGSRIENLKEITGDFDFVFVADGSGSHTRTVVTGSHAKEYEWAALWSAVPCGDWPHPETLWQCFDGTKRLLGFLPTGRLGAQGERLVSVFWSVFGADSEATRLENKWIEEAKELAPFAREVLEKIQPENVVVARYRHALTHPMGSFDGTPLCFLGDACHSMSPQLGLGANLALVEADEYSRAPLEGNNLAKVAENSYSRGRFSTQLSHLLFPLFQSKSTWIGPVRDAIAPTVVNLPIVKQQMLKTFAGRKTGWLR